MACGDEDLTLATFDDYTENNVFLGVTGITKDDFCFVEADVVKNGTLERLANKNFE